LFLFLRLSHRVLMRLFSAVVGRVRLNNSARDASSASNLNPQRSPLCLSCGRTPAEERDTPVICIYTHPRLNYWHVYCRPRRAAHSLSLSLSASTQALLMCWPRWNFPPSVTRHALFVINCISCVLPPTWTLFAGIWWMVLFGRLIKLSLVDLFIIKNRSGERSVFDNTNCFPYKFVSVTIYVSIFHSFFAVQLTDQHQKLCKAVLSIFTWVLKLKTLLCP
jgi:hypothetical protein